MKLKRNDRLTEFKRIEKLLYGNNYEVWFNLYGPGDTELSLEKSMKKLISNSCFLSGSVPSSPSEARKEILSMVLSDGDHAYGPIDLQLKKNEITTLINNVFTHISLDRADLVAEFGFRKGHPHYPVFWDFAYDVHSEEKRWLFIGSSSD